MTGRFVVESWGQGWLVLDRKTRCIVGSVGDLQTKVLQAAILNEREEETWKAKVVPIRS